MPKARLRRGLPDLLQVRHHGNLSSDGQISVPFVPLASAECVSASPPPRSFVDATTLPLASMTIPWLSTTNASASIRNGSARRPAQSSEPRE